MSESENKSQWTPAGLERFSHLEDKIFRTVEEIKAARKENEVLRAEVTLLQTQLTGLDEQLQARVRDNEVLLSENDSIKAQIEIMRQSETESLELLAQFEKEREVMRERVEKTLELLASLDMQ